MEYVELRPGTGAADAWVQALSLHPSASRKQWSPGDPGQRLPMTNSRKDKPEPKRNCVYPGKVGNDTAGGPLLRRLREAPPYVMLENHAVKVILEPEGPLLGES